MPDRAPATTEFASRSLRLDTLVRLRWLAVVGQATAVLFVSKGLGFPLPMVGCLALIGLSAVVNLALRVQFRPIIRLGQWPALMLLAYDLAQLGGLLFLTGGLDNPFALLLLVPVIVSATTLPPAPPWCWAPWWWPRRAFWRSTICRCPGMAVRA